MVRKLFRTGVLLSAFIAVPFAANAIESANIDLKGDSVFRWNSLNGQDTLTPASTPPGSGDFTQMRIRIGADMEVSDSVSVFFQPQFNKTFGEWHADDDANVAGAAMVTTSGNRNSDGSNMQVHQAFANWAPMNSLSIKLGRSEMDYGAGVIFSRNSWDMFGGPVFDGMSARYDFGLAWVDLFHSKLVENDSTNGINANNRDRNLSGIYAGWDWGFDWAKEIDTYWYQNYNASNGQVVGAPIGAAYTAAGVAANSYNGWGLRLASDMNNFFYHAEYSKQKTTAPSGRGKDMLDAGVGYDFGTYGLMVDLGYIHAGADFADNFSNYHDYLGRADIFSRNNIRAWRLGVAAQPMDTLKVRVDYHMFAKHNANAASGGGNNMNGAVGTFNGGVGIASAQGEKDLGSEIDVIVSYMPSKKVNFDLELSMFSKGDHFENNTVSAAGGTFLNTDESVRTVYASANVMF